MRHCFGEAVDVYEVSGNKVSKLFKKAGKKIAEFEDDGDYSTFSTQLHYIGNSGLGEDWALTVYAHS